MAKKITKVTNYTQHEKRVARYMQEVTDMQKAGVTRRDLMKMGLTAGVGGIVSMGGGRSFLPNLANAGTIGFPGALISPPALTPWLDPLPIPKAAVPCTPTANSGKYSQTIATQAWARGQMIGPAPTKDPYLNTVDLPHEYVQYYTNARTNIPLTGFTDARARSLGVPNWDTRDAPVPGGAQDPTIPPTGFDSFQRWDELLTGNVGGAYKLLDPTGLNSAYTNPQSNTIYELCAKEIKWNFYSDAPNGYSPGLGSVWTFFDCHSDAVGLLRLNAHYGKPVLMRMYNMMCQDNAGVSGINQMSTHLHNGHTPPESDGGPLRFFDAGEYRDYWYPNIREGFSGTHKTGTSFVGPDGKARWCPGDYTETQSSLWFHDHRMDFTSQNVFKGLASFYALFSDDINLDTGYFDIDPATGTTVESLDPTKRGLGFPTGDYDIPIAFTDKSFLQNGEMFFDLADTRGMVGDMQTVNLKIKPKLDVAKRKYRFRLLVAGPSRFGQYCITDNTGKKVPFLRIANDGNLLPKAVQLTDVKLGVAERADIIIDFSDAGLKGFTGPFWLHNILEQTTPQGTNGKTVVPDMSVNDTLNTTKIMKINVTAKPFKDNSSSMTVLAAQNQLPLPLLPSEITQFPRTKGMYDLTNRSAAAAGLVKDKAVKNRVFNFGKNPLNQWVVNNNIFDPSVITAYPIEGQGEIWQWAGGIGWSHPVHHHHCESQILTINGVTTIPADELSRKDVYRIGDGAGDSKSATANRSAIQFYLRFRDWYGDYPVHCHNVVHEDHAMMFRVKVVPPTDPNAGK